MNAFSKFEKACSLKLDGFLNFLFPVNTAIGIAVNPAQVMSVPDGRYGSSNRTINKKLEPVISRKVTAILINREMKKMSLVLFIVT